MPLSAGDRVDRYEVLELLGSGGMGEVYRARDPKLARLVALKVLRVASGPGTDGAMRILREARAVAALSHANVLAVFDVGEVQEPEALRGLAYIAMELVVGRPLRAYVGDASVPLERRIGWLSDIARALAAAHAAGIVHRDVKPENVMIRSDGAVKVLDFGIARRVMTSRLASTEGTGGSISDGAAEAEQMLATMTEEGRLIGTPYYMAPEQLRAEAVDGRSDQFAWGVIAYELLTGVAPWQREANPLVTVSEILSLDPRPPRELEARIPEALSDAILRALSKKRAERFVTMEALLEVAAGTGRANESADTAAPVAPQAVTQPEAQAASGQGTKGPARRGTGLGLAVAAVVVVGVGGAFLAVRAAGRKPAVVVVSAPKPAECTNRGCVESHGGEPYVCRASDHACVKIASEDCTPMYEPRDLKSDDTVWIGAMFPTKGPPTGANGPMSLGGTDFARREIAAELGSLEGSNAALPVRRLALVACDDSEDVMRAAKHLVDDVGVPAVIGFRSGKEVMDVAGALLVQRGVLTMASLTTAPQITRIPQSPDLPHMVWRTTFSNDRVAEVTAHMIEAALEHASAARKTRVTVVRTEGVAGLLSFAETFYRQLSFNGRPAVENEGSYQEVTCPPTPTSEAIETLADRVAATAPTVLLILGGSSLSVPLMNAVELRMKVAPPTYVVPLETMKTFGGFVGKDSDRRRRVFSVQSTSNSMANARFVIRYNEARGEHVGRELNPATSYDAFYLLAYATFIVGKDPVTGSSLGRAFARLVPPGAPIEVGPTNLYEALGLLSNGGRIDLQGASTALDFDLSTGEGPVDFVLVCMGVNADGSASGADVESGLGVSAKTGRVSGAVHCP